MRTRATHVSFRGEQIRPPNTRFRNQIPIYTDGRNDVLTSLPMMYFALISLSFLDLGSIQATHRLPLDRFRSCRRRRRCRRRHEALDLDRSTSTGSMSRSLTCFRLEGGPRIMHRAMLPSRRPDSAASTNAACIRRISSRRHGCYVRLALDRPGPGPRPRRGSRRRRSSPPSLLKPSPTPHSRDSGAAAAGGPLETTRKSPPENFRVEFSPRISLQNFAQKRRMSRLFLLHSARQL